MNNNIREQITIIETNKGANFTKTCYDGYNTNYYHQIKIGCYQQKKTDEHGNEYKNGHFCYNCKNELFFKCEPEKNYPPFRVHEIYIGAEQKKATNGLDMEVEYYQAYCCKCGKNKEPCYCQEFINAKIKEHSEKKQEYLTKLSESELLIKQFENLKNKDENYYTNKRLSYYIENEQEERENYNDGASRNDKYLRLVKDGETKRNQQIKET